MADVVGGKAVETGLGRFGGEKARNFSREPGVATDPPPKGGTADAQDGDAGNSPARRVGPEDCEKRAELGGEPSAAQQVKDAFEEG